MDGKHIGSGARGVAALPAFGELFARCSANTDGKETVAAYGLIDFCPIGPNAFVLK